GPGIELPRESRARAGSGGRPNSGEIQVEEITHQRLALIVLDVTPGVGRLNHPAASLITNEGRQRVVIRRALRGPISDVRQVGIIRAVYRTKIAIHNVRGNQSSSIRT